MTSFQVDIDHYRFITYKVISYVILVLESVGANKIHGFVKYLQFIGYGTTHFRRLVALFILIAAMDT